ncbi:MAG: hypothetical protein IPK82_03345 [Polyangiaceae bacterium]|nr:hypothetical protein [Polyangiaceae bacterium]
MSSSSTDIHAATSGFEEAPRRTMPPPELWDRAPPASVSQIVLSELRVEPPLLRHAGPRAELSHAFSKSAAAAQSGDAVAEREALITVARILSARGTELDTATAAARKALSLGDDAALRSDLGSWLAGLGEPALAAAALRGIETTKADDAERNLLKIAVLLGRAGDAPGAADALREAAELLPTEPMAHELLGMLASFAPEDVNAEQAAAAYGDAALRRAAAGERDAALEDRLRAFEIAPGFEPAARALADALAEENPAAADEVIRAHAGAVSLTDSAHALAIHRERMRNAAAEGDAARAVGALLDAWLEGDVGGEYAEEADHILLSAGLGEMVAARLSLYAEERNGQARAEAYLQLGKLYAGSLASPERAAEAFAEAFVTDPRVNEAMTLLAKHSEETHDPWPLVEALIRVGMKSNADYAEPNQRGARVGAIQELSAMAEDKLADPHLSAWALKRLVEAGASSGIGARLDRLSPRLRLQEDSYEQALGRLASAEEDAERALTLRRALAFLRGRPEEAETYFKLARELWELAPSDPSAADDVVRAATRAGKEAELLNIVRADANARAGRDVPGHARSLARVCTLLRKAGDESAVLAELMEALGEPEVHDSVASATLLHACRLRAVKERAEALSVIATGKPVDVAAVVLSVAVDLWLAVGDEGRARAVSTRAARLESGSPRAAVVRAAMSLGKTDRESAGALENVMTAVFPRGLFCDGLSTTLGELGEHELSFAWTKRWLALRPASPDVSELLLRRALLSKTAPDLADALGAVFAQPRPPGALSDLIGDVLEALARVDAVRAVALARRALDVLGPRVPEFRKRLLAVAEKAKDNALSIAILERYLATGPAENETVEVALILARKRVEAGEVASAARLYSRAVMAGADPEVVLAEVEPLVPEVEAKLLEATPIAGAALSDALVFLSEARALALSSLGESRAAETSYAFRVWGGLLWDLAHDQVGAESAFFQASTFVPEGPERYARDLRAFSGAISAVGAVETRAASLAEDPSQQKLRAALLIEASNLALGAQDPERALRCASTAIEIDPSRSDAVALVERSSHVDGGLAVLDHSYDVLAGAALGCFGRRAAHYRGARQLERRGAIDMALRHAIESFEAVPMEGSSFFLLSRLAERATDSSEAVRALERVAERADGHLKPVWLKRAAQVAGTSDEGLRTRFDLLLRALVVRADVPAIRDVAAALHELIGVTGDRETPTLRLVRAIRSLLPKLDGPDGARAGVAFARLAIEDLRDLPLGLEAVIRAASADGDIEDYLTLSDCVGEIAKSADIASGFVNDVQSAAAKPYSSVGPSLLQFAGLVSQALGDKHTAAALLIEAAKRASDDDDLVAQADATVAAADDEDLTKALDLAVAPKTRVEALLRIAERHETNGQEVLAANVLARVRDLGPGAPEARERVVAWLRRLYAMAGRPEAIEELLREELPHPEVRPVARARYARDLAAILSGRGDHKRALEIVGEWLPGAPVDSDLLADLRRFGRRARDPRTVADTLARLLAHAPDEASKAAIEGEIGRLSQAPPPPLEGAEGPPSIVRSALDSQVLESLEQEANRRGDHDAVADYLDKRVQLAEMPDVRRMLRLRRVAVLEQRLGRIADAAAELQNQLAETPDDVIALRYLADMRERSTEPVAAAELWERLANIAPTIDEKGEYGLRATSNLIAGGEIARARELLERFATMAPRENVVELRVQIARHERDHAALASALDQLASSVRETPSRRAEWLLEAARAAATMGDDSGALERTRRALKLVPDLVEGILELLRAEYRLRGPGTPREAQAAVAELQRIAERVPDAHVDLHAFLLAEEMDVIQGGGAGMRELSRRHAEVGALPLIALGMAERLVRSRTFEPAVTLYETALSGDLRGLRVRGRVALAAAEAATAAGDIERAKALLQIAAGESETRSLALRRQAELSKHPPPLPGSPPPAGSQPPPLPGAPTSGPVSPPPLPAEPSVHKSPPPLPAEPSVHKSPPPLPPEPSVHKSPPPLPPEPPVSARPPPASQAPPSMDELDPPDMEPDFETMINAPAIDANEISLMRALDAAEAAFPTSRRDDEDDNPEGAQDGVAAPNDSPPPVAPSDKPVVIVGPPPLPDLQRAPPPLPRSVVGPSESVAPLPIVEADEMTLRRELLAGSFEAGEQLVMFYAQDLGSRSRDILAVRRQQAAIRPGDLIALARLHEAAAYDGNTPYANAVEHVLGVFESSGGLTPPPLSAQRDAPALVSSLLFRQVDSLVNEALSIVWETGLYRRDTASYGLTGVERIQPNSSSALGEVFSQLLRLFGMGRVWLFHRRAPGPIRAEVALLASPSVVLTGDIAVTDQAALLHALGSHLTGAMPEHALVNGMPEDELRTLIDALVAAFGPLDASPRGNRAVVRLEQSLWQLIPPRSERRLREICAHPQQLTFENALVGTRQAMRRAGLFASGSLSTAVRSVAEQTGYNLEPLKTAPDGLEKACAQSAEIADLVRLAIRTEYAEARWLPPRSETQGPESRRSRYV